MGVEGDDLKRGNEKDSPVIFTIMRNPLGRLLLRNIDSRAMTRRGLQAAYGDRALVTPALVDRYVDLSRAPGHRDILLSIRTRRDQATTTDTFKEITIPTLVMHGEKDLLIPMTDSMGFAKAFPAPG